MVEFRRDTDRRTLRVVSRETYRDEHDLRPGVRAIVRDAKREHYSFSAIVKGVAASAPFRMRTAPDIVNGRAETVAAATGTSGGGN